MDANISFNDQNKGSKMTTVELPLNLWELAKKNIFSFKDLLIFGLQFKLAEKDPYTYQYPNNSLSNKIIKLQKIIEDQNKIIEDLENPKEKIEVGENEQ